MNQPVLIVGGTGKTGRRVSEKLLQKGYRSVPDHVPLSSPLIGAIRPHGSLYCKGQGQRILPIIRTWPFRVLLKRSV
ncbi:hypothetical protein, partial [Paenibacillus sp. AR247]|uniref:hypothetical protein n=1 Tax=Paenibacillus sp. AR247 TaxID=1631599 RepID=UPI00215707E2